MRKRKTRYNLYIGAAGIAVIILVSFIASPTFNSILTRSSSSGRNLPSGIFNPAPYHAHADFKVFIDGSEFSFNKSAFDVADRYVHLHLRNPDGDKVMHIEGMENATLKIFFDSIGITFNASCFITESENYCNTFEKRIRLFVNGKENFQFDFYEPRDLDRIMISYGNHSEEELKEHTENVTRHACIFSNKCPERTPELGVKETQLIF